MTAPSVLILACGALAKELQAVIDHSGLDHVTVSYLPAELHNRPERIPTEVEAALDRLAGEWDRVVLGYGDCGTGGLLDRVCGERGIERLPGAHCYEFLGGAALFEQLHSAEPGTLYLTDYLARHFDRLIIRMLGIDRHPELESMYFGNYRKLVHLAQQGDDDTRRRAEAAAERLGLTFDYHRTGLAPFAEQVVSLSAPTTTGPATGPVASTTGGVHRA